MKTYLAYLFDMDGTIVNSEKFKGMALSETCKLFGGQAAYENYRDVMGENWSIVINYFSISNSEALVFEDSRAGLIAAKKAGCDAIAFQHEFNVNHDLSSAIKTITDFTEIPL